MRHAHARRADPETSHMAARAIDPYLSALQIKVEDYALEKGEDGFCDAQMCDELDDPLSTLRTRRSELVEDRNILKDSGRRQRWGGSARSRIVWIHRKFHPDPGPIIPPGSKRQKVEADVKLANELASIADFLEREGREAAAETIRRGADRVRAKKGR